MNTYKCHPAIARYNLLRDGKHIECNILGWKTALAHARKWSTDLFDQPRKVEILNVWTGEIIDLAQAEKRAAEYALKRRANAAVSLVEQQAVRT